MRGGGIVGLTVVRLAYLRDKLGWTPVANPGAAAGPFVAKGLSTSPTSLTILPAPPPTLDSGAP